MALTIAHEEHSDLEVRWVTLGMDTAGRYILVIHTFSQLGADRARIRLISARKPTRAEIRYYEEQR